MDNRIFLSGNETYSNYRIPGLTVTAKGTLLAYFEARRTCSDWADMDILLFRSEDGGETFSEPIVLAHGTERFPTVNNPVCFAEPDGTLHFLYCRDYTVDGGHIFYRRSDDDGKTWSEPRDVMASTRPDFHNVFACGPGHGIVTDGGMLLVPAWIVPKEANAPVREHHPSVLSTFVSEDHGNTWRLGEIIRGTDTISDPNESAAAELPDGRIYLNIRAVDAGYRAVSYSPDGTSRWSVPAPDRALPDPTCFGSVVRYRHDGADALLCVNCASQTERENLVCRVSFDGGAVWSRSLTVEPGNAGYADIAVLPDGTVCVLYEQAWGTVERLARFSLAELR